MVDIALLKQKDENALLVHTLFFIVDIMAKTNANNIEVVRSNLATTTGLLKPAAITPSGSNKRKKSDAEDSSVDSFQEQLKY